ncbi:MAG TPA: integrase [Alphaproteobacteria bacterium]|nr:integrase [Alphaproteobacteria bacterium]
MPKLTKSLIEQTKPDVKDIILRDTEVKGLLCKITPKGNKVFMLYYKTKGGRERKPKLGSFSFMTVDTARQTAKEYLLEVSRGGDPFSTENKDKRIYTVQDLSERYNKEYAPKKKKRSAKQDENNFKLHVIPKIGHLKVSEVTNRDIVKLHNSMEKIPVTANRVLSLLSKAFNLAEDWKLLPEGKNPCRKVKKYKENRKERYLTKDEINNLFKVLDDNDDKQLDPIYVTNAIRLLLVTGCRLSEILTLKWDYINFDKSRFQLPDSKTGQKIVNLSEQAIKILKSTPKVKGNPYVIIGREDGNRLINLQKPWTRIRKRANITDVRLHDLRHTFASVAIGNGVSLEVIGALLGHRSIETTARYAHLQDELINKATNKIGNSIVKNEEN